METSGLSFDFFAIVIRSVVFTLVQAFFAAGISALWGCSWSLLELLSGYQKASQWRQALSRFLFSIPGVTMAFLFLSIFKMTGLGAIVLCQVFFSVLWVRSTSRVYFEKLLLGPFRLQVISALSMGSGQRSLFVKGPLGVAWAQEVRYFFVYLFFIFISSFSLVLILGASPAYSTLDVLIFYELMNIQNPWRVTFVAMVQILMGVCLYLLLRKDLSDRGEGLPTSGRIVICFPSSLKFVLGGIDILLGVGLAGLLISEFIKFPFWHSMDREFFNAALNSLYLGLSSVLIFGMVLFCLSFLSWKKWASWRNVGLVWPQFLMTVIVILFLRNQAWVGGFMGAGAVLVLASLPWIFYVLAGSYQKVPVLQTRMAETLGASHFRIFWGLVFPYAQPVIINLLLFVLLAALADVFVSQFFLEDYETLAQLGRRWAQRYHFAGMSAILSLQLVVAVGCFFVGERLGRRIQQNEV